MTSRGELLEREEQLARELRSLETELSGIGNTLSKLGNSIATPARALEVSFANTDFGRPINIVGPARQMFDFRQLQTACSFERVRDTVGTYLTTHAELFNLQAQLGRGKDELELYKVGGP